MDDEIAGGEARRLGDDVCSFPRALARAHQPVAENVLLGDDCEVTGLEAALEAELFSADGFSAP
jgi:hypothetical protein